MTTGRPETTCVQQHCTDHARLTGSADEGRDSESRGANASEMSAEDEAARRQQEMREWQHDWQVLGRWLMSGATAHEASQGGVVTGYQCDSPLEDEEHRHQDDDNVDYYQHQEDSNLLRSLSTPSPGSQSASGRQLEKRRSLRVRMQRGVSDGYVLALKTVAAVRRVGREGQGRAEAGRTAVWPHGGRV